MDAVSARLLVSPEGRALIDSLPPYDGARAITLGAELRAHGADPGLVAAALTQSRLRADAAAKFGDFASGMLFTQDGLEQATRLQVAAEHARRFRDAGVRRVHDLTAGIGADAMALAAMGLEVTAFEIDEATALIADHNLRHWDRARVVLGDAMTLAPQIEADGVFADPARRTARGRRHDPRDYAPPLDDVLALRERFPALGVKVGPAIDHSHVPTGVEAQWVSVDGSVVEAALWCGPLAQEPGHTALVIGADGAHRLAGTTDRADAGALGDYVYEPDGAVIRAGLVGELAHLTGTHLLDPTIAYLTSDSPLGSPFVRGYRILESMPFKVKPLAAALRARDVGTVDIKKRGVDVTPEQLRPQLRLQGSVRLTVIVTRVAGRRTALLAEPLAQQ
ncbi:THUMP-like domain-containing protein [Demequina muriae]|uniref:SAM-dependent methyltransferase n=1 Tax=Demequina muriae TaxID=3051664 RepID=A0ABT8GHH6_9MICO|nr:SAM-dependent methyltransferase [Demequina sp. EGI L300058]MDN4480880.1 SAM-dependent methyltransferase [Demequina sp. EGI L300058]